MEHETQGNEEDIQPYSNPHPLQSLYAKGCKYSTVVLTYPQDCRIKNSWKYGFRSVQFSSVQLLSRVQLFATP